MTISTNEPLDKEAEQRRLEEEMQKRKNRIEQWRAEPRTKLGIDKAMQQQIAQTTQGKAWSLEDEHDEDEEEDDEDPLDKFMEDIVKEVKTLRGNVVIRSNEGNTKGIKQEQVTNNPKGSIVKIMSKTIKNEVRTI